MGGSYPDFLKDVGAPWWVVWPARILRSIGFEGIVRRVRTRATLGLFAPLHLEVVHRMRNLAISIASWDSIDKDVGFLSNEVCTACAKLMGDLLELETHEIHCCIKVFLRDESGDESQDRVVTLARSTPLDDRPYDDHLVSANTVWCALLGRKGPLATWSRPLCCFVCNDLVANRAEFACTRDNWERYYNSTLVFPLRYITDPKQNKYRTIGFLAFDSKDADAYAGLPDAFKYRTDPDRYSQKLWAQAPFHLGAIMADTLSMFLRGAYEEHAEKGTRDAEA